MHSLITQIAAFSAILAQVQAEVTAEFIPPRHNSSYELPGDFSSIDEAHYTDILGHIQQTDVT